MFALIYQNIWLFDYIISKIDIDRVWLYTWKMGGIEEIEIIYFKFK